ncbi:hypothetical protein CHS0354_038600 [Potamilus streckersoni]|uniref:G-protein coupled receptors family 1 profile domain-containing protein n=1 Tax=Potamilus streckersoni TaxID=2493646 RepID=A0AAE0WCI2_9BIVA|nr:hypothetical protein CHS0354_038600 [Potamilus streckersoni]
MTMNSTEEDERLIELNDTYARALLPVTILHGFISVMGIMGNLIVIVIFSKSREYKQDNFRVFVLFLAVIDIVGCVFLVPAEMIKHAHYFSFENAAACKLKCFFNVLGCTASTFTLILISVDRCRRVCQPLRKQIGTSLAFKLCTILCIIAVIISIPAPVFCGVRSDRMENHLGGNTTVFLCSTETIYQSNIWQKIYTLFSLGLLVIFSLFCAVIYFLIGREIWKNSNFSHSTCLSRCKSNSDILPIQVHLNPGYDINNGFIGEEEGKSLTRETSTQIYRSRTASNASSTTEDINRVNVSTRNDSKGALSMVSNVTKKRPCCFKYRKTLIWFLVTLVFILTYIIYCGLLIERMKRTKMSAERLAVFSLFERLYFLNNMANPIIYACLYNKFRRSCKTYLNAIITYVCRAR